MPRRIPRSKTEQDKANIQKVNTANAASKMLEILSEIQRDFECDLLRQVATQPASDLESIQRNYKACIQIANKLRSKINDGMIAESKLKKED